MAEAKAARPRLFTFDVYTALFDHEASLVPVVEACGIADAAALVRRWRAKQLEYAQLTNSLPGGRLSFRLVTRRALDHVLARAGREASERDRERCMRAWDELRPWPEAQGVLSGLAARGYELGLLSNGDEDMLRALASRLGVKIAHIFASDRAGAYKPHPSMYALPSRELGIGAADFVHVAGSGNDVLGARLSGLRCAWSNRAADVMIDPAVRPHYEMRDLSGLLEVF
jgi:2-haloacid dehalogenase